MPLYFLPGRCARAQEWGSLRLDGNLSPFESALLRRHLAGCDTCRAFVVSIERQTALLRAAPLEEPTTHIAFPAPSHARRRGRRIIAGAAATFAAAAAAASLVIGTSAQQTGASTALGTRSTTGGEFIVVTAQLNPAVRLDVPRLKMEPASYHDGPVRGLFGVPA